MSPHPSPIEARATAHVWSISSLDLILPPKKPPNGREACHGVKIPSLLHIIKTGVSMGLSAVVISSQ